MTAEDFMHRLERLRDSSEQKMMIADTWKLSYESFLFVSVSAVCVSVAAYLGFSEGFEIEFWVAAAFALLFFVCAHVTQKKALIAAKWQDRDYLLKSFELAENEEELEQAGFPHLENVELVFHPVCDEDSHESTDAQSEDIDSNAELSEEESDRQAKVVSQVQSISQMLVLRSDGFEDNDSYEVEQVEKLLRKVNALLPSLTDPFYASAARHAIIDALMAFNRLNDARNMLGEIEDEFIKETVLESHEDLIDA